MPKSPLSDRVKELLRQRIHSVEQLDALALLRAPPLRTWSDTEVASALQIPTEFARVALEGLVRNGLCRKVPGSGEFALQSVLLEDDSGLRDLLETYQEQRFAMIALISRSAIARVRLEARQTFFGAIRRPPKKSEH